LGTDAGALLGDVVLVDVLGRDGSCEGGDEREFVEVHCEGWQYGRSWMSGFLLGLKSAVCLSVRGFHKWMKPGI
jgi:hypothetical protein